MDKVIRQLCRAALLPGGGPLADGELLERFIARRDEAAFEALVRRHGPMVLGVCRRVLRNAADAEDAFQATFLVLVRKAAFIQARELVGHWLYRVAYLTALKARATAAKRRRREEPVRDLPQPEPPPEEGWLELLPLLDRELNALPEKYRVPVVLCDLEGRTHKEAALRLGCPEGTLSSRLARARKLLARRLARHGPALAGGTLGAVLAQSAAAARVPPSLVLSTTRAALGRVAAATRVIVLTEGVVKAMFLTKLKGLWAVALAVMVGMGAIGLAYRPAGAQPGPQSAQPDLPRRAAQAARVADELEELRLEVAALRKGLEATRARVKALENEVQTLRQGRTTTTGRSQQGAKGTFGRPGMETPMGPGRFGPMKGPMPKGAPSQGGPMQGQGPAIGGPMPQAGPKSVAPVGEVGVRVSPVRSLIPQAGPNPVAQGPSDPLAQAEAAMKKLRQNPQDKQAADALERALKLLRKKSKQPGPRPAE